jgi:muramoyltetrapeptide carboxypeptidase LdcA involved in peptidoglycan recycling
MKFAKLSKLKPGDKVAILSTSSDAASHFPWVLDLGLERLRKEFNLIPVEYPTTRRKSPSAKERANDLMEAFKDKNIKAIIATIGGSDQIKLLPHLDPEIISANPKPFMGYSDNTNLSLFLWNLGVPSYYGGAIMVQFAMPGEKMLSTTVETIRHSLLDGGEYTLNPAKDFTDIELEWGEKSNLSKTRSFEKNEGWYWDGNEQGAGRLWGGCIETLLQYLSAGKPIPNFQNTDIVLYLESAENIPDHWVVDTLLASLGERGVLDRTTAVLVGRPKAWEFNKQLSPDIRALYREKQRNTIVQAIRKYRSDIPIVQNIDFGHTDPQIIVPTCSKAVVDTTNRSIKFLY